MPQAAATVEEIDLAPVAGIVKARAPFTESHIIGALQEAQARYGYLPREVMDELARLTGVPVAKFYGVATFYAQFHLEPHGRHTVRLCRGTACHVRGAPKILGAVTRRLGIEPGGTTEDMAFSLETVACLGACALSPVMVVDGTYYGKMTPGRAEEVLRQVVAEENEE